MKAAVVAVVGRPSAGKSTLVNALCGAKVSIVSPVPQTTRNRVRGILTKDDAQIVFIDTPGFHLSEKKINRYMTDLVSSALDEVDVSLYVADGSRPWGKEEQAILEAVRRTGKPVVACLNKKDSAASEWPAVKQILREAFPGQPPLEISAKTGEGLEPLRGRLFALCPDGEQLYPPDYYTDQTPDFRVAEVLREKVFLSTREEIPHAVYVRIEDLEMRDGGTTLWARGFICVERESQKGILVGRGGEKIKGIVRDAEAELSEIFPWSVRLDIRVKVDREWRKRDPLLRKLIS
ncbi:MAG TPA: GTPase Era [Spirochaetia bacterium]|nr:GTPase Era [Spirochaetia bacterium]